MKYLKIRNLDTEISEVVLGTTWWEQSTKETVDEQIDTYLAAGGNTFDTGRFYNAGKAETFIKNWFKEHPGKKHEISFTSKACHYWVSEGNEHFPDLWRVSPDYITKDLEHSLSNLGLECFDMYMLHRDDEKLPVGPLMDRLEKHRREGKFKVYGLSNWKEERVKEAVDYCRANHYQGIDIASPSYSLATAKKPRWVGAILVGDSYARFATELGITILSWGSQGNGVFGNKPFPDKKTVDQGYKDCFENPENEEKIKRAGELAEKYGVVPSAIALAYILQQGNKVAGIIGPRDNEELRTSLEAEQVSLTQADIKWLSLEA